jgi:hypothetical protein
MSQPSSQDSFLTELDQSRSNSSRDVSQRNLCCCEECDAIYQKVKLGRVNARIVVAVVQNFIGKLNHLIRYWRW